MLNRYLPLFIPLLFALSACSGLDMAPPRHAEVRPLEFGGQLILPGGELQEERDFQLFFRRAGYVLIGEAHTNMTDHLSQAIIIEKMVQKRLRPIIGLEMVTVDNQHILDRFNSGEIGIDQLERALGWQRTVGYPFALYRPIFEVAEKHGIPVYALNIPRRVVREARLNGLDKIPERDKPYLPAGFIPVSEAQRAYLTLSFGQHPGLQMAPTPGGARTTENIPPVNQRIRPDDLSTPERDSQGRKVPSPEEEARAKERERTLEGFMTAQALWDSAMAERAVRIQKYSNRPIVIIAGQGHVEYGWGIARRISAYDPGARVITVMPWRKPMETVFMREQESLVDPALLPQVFPPPTLADIFYYSPAAPVGKAHGMVTAQNPASRGPQLMVLSVAPKSLAAKAGIRPGDIILELDRRTITTSEEFHSLLAQAAAYGRAANLTMLRDAEKLNIALPLD